MGGNKAETGEVCNIALNNCTIMQRDQQSRSICKSTRVQAITRLLLTQAYRVVKPFMPASAQLHDHMQSLHCEWCYVAVGQQMGTSLSQELSLGHVKATVHCSGHAPMCCTHVCINQRTGHDTGYNFCTSIRSCCVRQQLFQSACCAGHTLAS